MVNFAANPTGTVTPEKRKSGRISNREWQGILELHQRWLESEGLEGERADFSNASLESFDLTDAQLRSANFNQTNLRCADLLLANLLGASLLQADLRDANLLGARFHQADLQGANLTDAKALLADQLSGANLFGATLPDSISLSEALKQVSALAKRAGWLLAAFMAFIASACMRVATVTDVQLLKNSSAFPFGASSSALPLVPFFLFCPVLILTLFVFVHFHLQRLWEACARLPAILPDGARLDTHLPWFAKWPVRNHFRWLAQDRPALSALSAAIAKLLLYAPAPAAIFLFWPRYLTLQDLRGATLHALLTVAAAAAAFHFHAAANRAFVAEPRSPLESRAAATKKYRWARPALLCGLGLALVTLSTGVILGTPHIDNSAPPTNTLAVRAWAADAFWLIGYAPYAQLTESSISTGSRGWTGREEDLGQIQGANLNGSSLRFAEGYRAFLAKAHLWRADLSNARLSEADLREANLRQSSLRSAFLDQAKLNRANLEEADLHDANLTQADLTAANLSYASLVGAKLLDVKLDGANLYAAQLQGALLQRASLQKADLREADLEGANLDMANLQEAYLSSARIAGAHLQKSQLAQAILMQADLRHADLSGANLEGAILQGANLEGTQLRGALGLSVSQLCSAVNLSQAQLDDALRQSVDAQCTH